MSAQLQQQTKVYQAEIIENENGTYVVRAYLQGQPNGGDMWGIPFKGIKQAYLDLFGKMMTYNENFKLLIPATDYSSALTLTYNS